MSVRAIAIAAVVLSLLSSSRSSAQAPPTAPPPLSVEKTLELINMAREQINDKVERQQQLYQEFRLKNPYAALGGIKETVGLFAARLMKNETVLNDLQLRQAEVAARMALVKNVGDSEKDASALLVLIHRRGVDLTAIRQAAGKDIGPLDMVRLYATSLRLESEELDQLVAAAESRRDRDQKLARDMNSYVVEEEKLRASLEQSRDLLKAIVKRLQEVSIMKDLGVKMKDLGVKP